jgi:propionaldehyde dehydrogenase
MSESGIFDDIGEAIDAAYEAQQILASKFTTKDRDSFINKIKEKFLAIIDAETIKEFNETGYGRLDQKLIKNRESIATNPDTSDLKTTVYSSSDGLTVEYAAPVGLVGALTPVTNGIATVACNAMTMIAAGNSIVFNCHPAAKEAGALSVALVNDAVVEAGGPPNIATMVRNPDTKTLEVIMNSPKVQLLIGTGSEAMVKILMGANKKVIAAGPGNPPTVIDETADIKKAAAELYENVPFENNMLCVLEKEAFVVESVYDEFIDELVKLGSRILTDEETEKVIATALVTTPEGKYGANKAMVGKDANVVLQNAGIEPSPGDLKLAIIKAEKDNPFVYTEQMMPIFPIVKCKDFEEAMEWAIEAEGGCRHSAAIWSKDIGRITEYGRKINTTCFAANGCTVAAAGVGGSGEGSATIATTTGEGFTTPTTFTRVRRMALAHGDGFII